MIERGPTNTRHDVGVVAEERPNQLFKLTRYGSRRLAAPGHSVHCPSAASRRLPPRSA